MIILNMKDGLGNQFFEYAFAKYLQKKFLRLLKSAVTTASWVLLLLLTDLIYASSSATAHFREQSFTRKLPL